MTIKSVYEGSYVIDANKKFHLLNNYTEQIKGIKVAINPFIIKTDTDLLLIDTGLGFKSNNGTLKIHENIQNIGFHHNDITKVLFTHLHYDHIGGSFYLNDNILQASFPNAKYYLQEKELHKMLQTTTKQEHINILIALQKHANTILLNGNGSINNHIKYKVTGGHTEFHQIFIITHDQEVVVCGGDVIPLADQLNLKLVAKYDFDGKKSLQQRLHYANYLSENNGICLFYHSRDISIGRISKNNNTFNITNLE